MPANCGADQVNRIATINSSKQPITTNQIYLGTVNLPETFRLTMTPISQPCSLRKPMVDANSSLKRSISSNMLMKLGLARADAVTP